MQIRLFRYRGCIHKYLTRCNLHWHGRLLQTKSQLLSLIDSHISYYNLEAITFVNNYVHICSTHYTCTLDTDTTVFGPLKINWQDVCNEYIQSEPGKDQTKYQFNELFSKINIGFKYYSIYPFYTKAVLDHDTCVPKNVKSQFTTCIFNWSKQESSGIPE